VRGVQKQLITNTTAAETTETTGLTAFGSDGFTTGLLLQLNTITATYVAWNWKANGAGSSNTAGSITATVSANTTSGFSIATYTSQSSGTATVGHGLGVAPSMVIVKTRATAENWYVYHSALGGGKYIVLSTTNGAVTSANLWNNTAPTSTVFSLGTDWAGLGTAVAYCFAEVAGYSKFGSYVGNGSNDGPFLYCGFKPAYVLIKRTDTAGLHWGIWDTAVNTYNLEQLSLYSDSSGSEINATDLAFDGVSNGFKIRGNSSGINDSGGIYIFAAFASTPFKFSLAR